MRLLEQFSEDLIAKVSTMDPVIGREKEIDTVIGILCRKNKNNPALVGEPGVGKTAIAEGLAQRMAMGNVPPQLKDKKLKGFALPDAVLTAVESRSSSPVRIIRGEDMQSSIKGLYPCGEGAGYAGGIMSAAVDGIRIAQKILETAVHK